MANNSYWLDKDDAITGVSGSWDYFALENDGNGVNSSEIIGKPVWSFISGESSRMWLESLLQLVRLTGRIISRPYRCDSPELKRFMTMTIIPEGSGRLRLEHAVIATEPRPESVYIRYAARTSPSSFYQRCSVCGRVRLAQADSWVEPDELRGEGKANLSVIYAVCGECNL